MDAVPAIQVVPDAGEIQPRSQELLDMIVALMLCPFGP